MLLFPSTQTGAVRSLTEGNVSYFGGYPMPQPDGAADPGVKPEPVAQTQSASTATIPETTTETTSSSTSSLMEKLGVPAEVQQELESRKPKPEAAEPAQAEPEANAAAPAQTEPEQHDDPDAEASDEPKPSKTWPEDVQKEFQKRVGKEARKRRLALERAEKVELENEQLRAQLEATHPVTVMPSDNDLLADVTNETQLEERVKIAKAGRDLYRSRLNGFTVNEGTPQERFVSPEEVAITLGRFEDVINEAAPRKQREMQERREYDRVARAKYPQLFDRTSEDYQRAAGALQRFPWLARDPAANIFIGDYLRGAKARMAEENQASASSGDPAADKIISARTLTPPIAPNVPAAQRSNGSTPSRKNVDQAMNNLVADGSREALIAAIRAKREAGNKTTGARELVSV